tara:strand:- start:1061 stop:1342 length:282 start_codon:yes stop_codon:yes gene_type:complete
MKKPTQKFQARLFFSAKDSSTHVMLIWSVGMKLYNQKVVFKGNITLINKVLDDGAEYMIHLNKGEFPPKVEVIEVEKAKEHYIEVYSVIKTAR